MVLFPRVICLMPLLAAALVAGVVYAAPVPPRERPQPAQAQQQPRVPTVIVTKADGSTARGQIVSADGDNLVVRASEKTDPVTIPWASVKRVSNGLTQAQAWATWKEQNAGLLCDTCRGDRVTRCPSCHGTALDQSKPAPCDQCEGVGIADLCPAPKCNGAGKIDCPKPCLKLTQGTWRKRDDGKRWRDIRFAGGVHSYSEGHVGELVDMKTGTSLGKCPTCEGTTKIDCTTCDGLGVILCEKCQGVGATGPACPQCKAGIVACATCNGSGSKPVTPAPQ